MIKIQSESIILIPLVMFFLIVLFTILYSSRYRKFTPNEFIIWLRNGVVRKKMVGGAGFLYPLTDQIIVIPLVMQISNFQMDLFSYQDSEFAISLKIDINWRVKEPELFFTQFRLNQDTPYQNESVIILFKSLLRDSLGEKSFETIFKRSRELLGELKLSLNNRLKEFGILIESLEIEDILEKTN